MATQLRIHSADNPLFDTVIDEIDRGVQGCLATSKISKPILLMHWVELPGGGLVCHWDIDIPTSEQYQH